MTWQWTWRYWIAYGLAATIWSVLIWSVVHGASRAKRALDEVNNAQH